MKPSGACTASANGKDKQIHDYMKRKYTPEKIYNLKDNEIFVFGSNDKGHHIGGAAKFALDRFGAIEGKSTGLQGQSYAIITMSGIEILEKGLDDFIIFAENNPTLFFYMTKIGCGIAMLDVSEIERIFKNKIFPKNVALPIEFSTSNTNQKINNINITIPFINIKEVFKTVKTLYIESIQIKLHDFNSLTYGDYLQIICNNKYYLLKKVYGFVPKNILLAQLSRIFSDYNAATTNPEVKVWTGKAARLERLYRKQLEVYSAAKILCYKEHIESYILLKRYYIISGNEDRNETINKANAELKGLKLNIENIKSEIKLDNHDKKPVMSDYLREIQILRKQGYNIDFNLNIKLSEYAQIQNLAREEYERMKQELENRRNGTRNH